MNHRTRFLVLLFFVLLGQPAFAGKADLLASGTMGENISGGFGDFYIQSKSVFTVQSREVIWFGHFKGFMEAYKANLIADWITPTGDTFKKEKFTTRDGNARFGWAKLDIKGGDNKALELEGDWTVKVYWDDDLIDTQKFHIGEIKSIQAPVSQVSTMTAGVSLSQGSRFVRTMMGNQLVYEGPEKIDPALWKTEKTPFSELKMAGSQDASKTIAVLAYPYNLDISSSAWAFDRGKYMAGEIKKSGFLPGSIHKEGTLPEQYKYLLRYNLDQKRIEVNFFNDNPSIYFDLVEYSEERDKVGNVERLFGNGMFPHDLSGHVARKTVENFIKDGYRVLDLTVSRDDLSGKPLDEIMAMVHEKYGVDKVMFIPINAYTKWVWDLGASKETEIGLLLCYSVVLFERDKPDPIFTYTDNIDVGNASYDFLGFKKKTVGVTRINFYSEDWSEDRKKHPDRPIKFYKDGIFDDTWVASVVLGKFAGEKMYSVKDAKLVHVGGVLFQKLYESGLLSQWSNKIETDTMGIPAVTKEESSRSIDSYYEELGIKKGKA